MIILYDENELEFTSLGIGVLTDASSCVVTEELNGSFELEMEYPVSGAHYKDIKLKRLILVPPNDIDTPQPFRIYKVTRPIDGVVTVYAEHIFYDTSKVPIKAIDADDLDGVIEQIQNRKMIQSPFVFSRSQTKPNEAITFKTKVPYSMKALLAGNDDSIINIYSGDFIFNRFSIVLTDRRGADRDFTIRYSKNMLDIEQETTSELMFSGICPYYSNTNTETKTGISAKYKEIYLSADAASITPKKDPTTNEDIYPLNWLSYNDGGSAISKIVTKTVTNIIASEGNFQNHLVRCKSVTPVGETEEGDYFYDVTYNMGYINPNARDEFGRDWLYKDPELDQVWVPVEGQLFRIYSEGASLYKVYIYKYDTTTGTYKYMLPSDDDHVETYAPLLPTTYTETIEKDNILLYEGNIIYIDEVRAQAKPGETPLTEHWLQAIEENEQIMAKDPRWTVTGDIEPIEGVIYKVASPEEFTRAYKIEGTKDYAKDSLTLVEGSTVPLVPEDAKGYVVAKNGKDYKLRWYEYDQVYKDINDTRDTYQNYEWNGTQYILHSDTHDKILTLDLTDKFNDTPKNNQKFQKQIYDETISYIKENKLGQIKESIKVTFVKLSSSPEYSKWKVLERVELGDTVHVIYEDLGVNVLKKVTKTEYNVLTGTYDSIELGEKSASFTNNAIVSGDDISALTNDRRFADLTTVTNLIAERIEADYLKAATAELTEAQIQQLTAESIVVAVLDAEQFHIDELVAKLMVAEDAIVKNTLTAGELQVNGEINIRKGSITILGSDEISSVKAYVYSDAQEYQYTDNWLKESASATQPFTPEWNVIYDVYKMYNDTEIRVGYYKWVEETNNNHYAAYTVKPDVYFEVDANGNLTANSADIKGKITATEGEIGGCLIENGQLYINFDNLSQSAKKAIDDKDTESLKKAKQYTDDETITKAVINSFDVDPDKGVSITATIGGKTVETFKIDTLGNVTIEGTITATAGEIGGCSITNGVLQVANANISDTITADHINLKGLQVTDINGNVTFEVEQSGDVIINSGSIQLGLVQPTGESPYYNFEVNSAGTITAYEVILRGGSIVAESGKLTGIDELEVTDLTVQNDAVIKGDLRITGAISISEVDDLDTLTLNRSLTIGDNTISVNSTQIIVDKIIQYSAYQDIPSRDEMVGNKYLNKVILHFYVPNYPDHVTDSDFPFTIEVGSKVTVTFVNGRTMSQDAMGDYYLNSSTGECYQYLYFTNSSRISRVTTSNITFRNNSDHISVHYIDYSDGFIASKFYIEELYVGEYKRKVPYIYSGIYTATRINYSSSERNGWKFIRDTEIDPTGNIHRTNIVAIHVTINEGDTSPSYNWRPFSPYAIWQTGVQISESDTVSGIFIYDQSTSSSEAQVLEYSVTIITED